MPTASRCSCSDAAGAGGPFQWEVTVWGRAATRCGQTVCRPSKRLGASFPRRQEARDAHGERSRDSRASGDMSRTR